MSAVPTTTFSVPKLNSYALGGNRKVTMIYHERFSLNPAVASLASYVFRANSCYDPNYTGTGHQPRGFDQLMALYDHGTVIGSKMDVGIFSPNSVGATVAVNLRDSVSTPSTFDDMLEVPTCSWTIISPSAGGGVANLSQSCSPAKFLGRPKVLSEDDLRFSSSADCVEQAFYHIVVGPTDSLTDLSSIDFHVRIEYTVILSEPKLPGIS